MRDILELLKGRVAVQESGVSFYLTLSVSRVNVWAGATSGGLQCILLLGTGQVLTLNLDRLQTVRSIWLGHDFCKLKGTEPGIT